MVGRAAAVGPGSWFGMPIPGLWRRSCSGHGELCESVQDRALGLESDVGSALALPGTSSVTLARLSCPHEEGAGLGQL